MYVLSAFVLAVTATVAVTVPDSEAASCGVSSTATQYDLKRNGIKYGKYGTLNIWKIELGDRDRFCAIVDNNVGAKRTMLVKAGTRSAFYANTTVTWYHQDKGSYLHYAGPVGVTPGKGRCAVFLGKMWHNGNVYSRKMASVSGKFCN